LSGVCACNCGGGTYACLSNADCCMTGSVCSTDGLSTGCSGGVCQ
jgi:hypothetical protein